MNSYAETDPGSKSENKLPIYFVGLLLIALVFVSIWPSIYNGQPFFFNDTTTYVKGADAGVAKLTGITSVWTHKEAPASDTNSSVMGEPEIETLVASSVLPANQTVLSGRSIYYGTLLYLGDLFGGFWFTVVIQAMLYLTSIGLTLFNLRVFSWIRFSLIVAVLAVLTPAAFYNSYLMPDLFAGLTILASANLVVFGRSISNWQRLVWFVVLSLSMLFHSSHLLIAGAIVAIAAPWGLSKRYSVSWGGVGIIVLSIVTGFVGEAAFGFAVKKLTGTSPIRPPFVMARVIADGPGYDFLKEKCPDAGFVVCDYLDRLPTLNSDVFLWSQDPTQGVFTPEPEERKRALSEEQFRFAIAVVAYDPIGYLKSASFNIWSQLSQFGLSEFNYSTIQLQRYKDKVPEPYQSEILETPAARGNMPIRILTPITYVSVFLSLAIYSYSIFRRRKSYISQPSIVFSTVILWGILANAIICGLLSTPHDRYQARVIWLIPALVLVLESRTRIQSRAADKEPVKA